MGKWLDEAVRLKPYIEKGAQSLTDSDALKAKTIFPKWEDLVKVGLELLSDKLGNSIIVLTSVKKDNSGLSIFVKVSENFVKKGVNAGKIVAEIAAATEGKGGGRPNFAQGGGKKTEKLDDILLKVENDFLN